MNYAKAAFVALMAGITKYRAGTKEIEWVDKYEKPITVEVLDAVEETYIVRYYWDKDTMMAEYSYKGDLQHGRAAGYSSKGHLGREQYFASGKLHGKWAVYDNEGNVLEERYYEYGVRTK